MATMAVQGGWSLAAANCPAGTKACNSGAFCCPSSLNCMNSGDAIAEVCCPGQDDCIGFVEERNPTCADPAWSLWNATKATATSHDYFCCIDGQIGLQNGNCGLPLLIGPPPTNEAVPVSTLPFTGTLSATTLTVTAPSSSSTGTGISSTGQQSTTSLPPSTPTAGASGATTGSTTGTSASPSSTTHPSGAFSMKHVIPVGLVLQFVILSVALNHF